MKKFSQLGAIDVMAKCNALLHNFAVIKDLVVD